MAARGFLTEPPQARLAVLPGTSHIGIMANAELIAGLVAPFLMTSRAHTEGLFLVVKPP